MTDWQEKYDFSNIDPIYHQESANSLAEILYDDDYKSAIGYMRALMARDEHSARALAVVQAVIMRNPAHYTAWHYRLQILKGAGHDIVPKEAWIFHAAAPEIESDDDSEEEDEKEATNSADIKEKTEDQEEEGETKQPTEVEPVAEEPMPVIENYTWLNDVTLDNPKTTRFGITASNWLPAFIPTLLKLSNFITDSNVCLLNWYYPKTRKTFTLGPI